MKEVDYLIIGQGISGTLLSRFLQQAGKTIIVIDEGARATASKVSGGLINPVTGKRLVRSWMIEQFFPFAWDTYRDMENELGTPLVSQNAIVEFHATRDASDFFMSRMQEEGGYLRNNQEEWRQYFRYNYGVHQVSPCLLIHTSSLLAGWRSHLQKDGLLLEERFNNEALVVADNGVCYENIRAQKIVFCDGVACSENPYFNRLPWSKDKGEALIVSIPGLPPSHIFRQAGVSILPRSDGLFWVGASHDWKYTDVNPSASYRAKVEEHLDYWLKLPYTITDHIVALRPSNIERRPFVGLHPQYPNVGILNGMGSKGLSMAPFCAYQLAGHLVHQTHITPDTSVERFRRILAR